jgi:ferredoxin
LPHKTLINFMKTKLNLKHLLRQRTWSERKNDKCSLRYRTSPIAGKEGGEERLYSLIDSFTHSCVHSIIPACIHLLMHVSSHLTSCLLCVKHCPRHRNSKMKIVPTTGKFSVYQERQMHKQTIPQQKCTPGMHVCTGRAMCSITFVVRRGTLQQ